MNPATLHYQQLTGEYQVLMRHYGQTQTRCDALVRAQGSEIARLQSQAMRLRAGIIVRETALAWEREQRAEALRSCLQSLARERLQWQWRELQARSLERETMAAADRPQPADDHLAAANLVICQTGCLSHGDYWRDQDQCRRSGKACVLAEQSAVARIPGFEAPARSSPEGTA